MPRRLVDIDPDREARRQSAILDQIESRFLDPIEAEIARASGEIVRAWELSGEVHQARDHYENMQAIYQRMGQVSFEAFGMRIADQGKSGGFILEVKETFLEALTRAALDYIMQEIIRARIVSVTETTRQQIVAQVERGFRDGLSVAEIAGNIREKVPAISRLRASVIARTETHGAANAGADAAARATGLRMRKEWISVLDYRTRGFAPTNGRIDPYDHRRMNGQTVGMDEPFLMPFLGGDPVPCMFPGDPALPAAASINCRCAVSHQVIGLD